MRIHAHLPDLYKGSMKMFFSGTFQDQNPNVQIPSPIYFYYNTFPFTNPEIITMFSLITLDVWCMYEQKGNKEQEILVN